MPKTNEHNKKNKENKNNNMEHIQSHSAIQPFKSNVKWC